jgi:hypothetical protein
MRQLRSRVRLTKGEAVKRLFAIVIAIVIAVVAMMFCAGCGDDNSTGPTGPSIPAGLSATGSLHKIELAWNASSGGGLTGYNVYRSADGVDFTKLNASPLTDLAYLDTDVDGEIYYSYKVTAIGTSESGFSRVVRSMLGTRLLSSYASGCVVAADTLNPYIAEDTVKVDGGNLEIQPGARLYVLDRAVVDMEVVDVSTHRDILVNGLLRVVSSTSASATLTAHKTGGALADGEGFAIWFNNTSEDYNPGDGSGTLVQNCNITYLKQGNFAIRVTACAPRFYNCKIYANRTTGGSYFEIFDGGAPTIEHCDLTRIVLTVRTNLIGTGASIVKNTCRDGYYSIYFSDGSNGMVDSGQIANNDFDGTVNGLYLLNVAGSENIPLGNNYWDGGVPTVIQNSTTATVAFAPTLAVPPADCGPTW